MGRHSLPCAGVLSVPCCSSSPSPSSRLSLLPTEAGSAFLPPPLHTLTVGDPTPRGWETGRCDVQPEAGSCTHSPGKWLRVCKELPGLCRDTAGGSTAERLKKICFCLNYVVAGGGASRTTGSPVGGLCSGCVLCSDAVRAESTPDL